MKKLLIVVAVAGIMTGCVNRVSDLPHPDGGVGQLVQCDGLFKTWVACYREASMVCKGRPFKVSNEQSSARPFGGAFIFGSIQDRSMVIQCKEGVATIIQELDSTNKLQIAEGSK